MTVRLMHIGNLHHSYEKPRDGSGKSRPTMGNALSSLRLFSADLRLDRVTSVLSTFAPVSGVGLAGRATPQSSLFKAFAMFSLQLGGSCRRHAFSMRYSTRA